MNIVDDYGNTDLMVACEQEDYETIYHLLQQGDNVDTTNTFGETPLLQAVRYAYKDEVAARKIVELLLDKTASIDAQTVDGETALMRAAYYGYFDLLVLLMSKGANVNLRRTDGNTVLSSLEAAPSLARKRKKIIKFLEQAGAVR